MWHRELWAGVIAAKKHLLSGLMDPGCPRRCYLPSFAWLHFSNRKLSLKRVRKKVCQAGSGTLQKIKEAGANHPAARPRRVRKKKVCFQGSLLPA